MFREVLKQQRRVIATFSNLEAAGEALDRLILSGFPIAQTFLVGQNSNRSENPASLPFPASDFGTITGTATGLKKGLILGNLLGGASGLLLGTGLLALPGVGQVALSTAIVFTLLSGGICTATGGLIGGLISLGLSAEEAKKYSRLVANGNVLLLIEGTVQDIDFTYTYISSMHN